MADTRVEQSKSSGGEENDTRVNTQGVPKKRYELQIYITLKLLLITVFYKDQRVYGIFVSLQKNIFVWREQNCYNTIVKKVTESTFAPGQNTLYQREEKQEVFQIHIVKNIQHDYDAFAASLLGVIKCTRIRVL